MRNTKFSLALAAAALAAGLAAPAAQAQSSSTGLSDLFALSSTIGKALAAGGIGGTGSTVSSTEYVSVAGQGQRSYILEVPQDYDAGRAYPVIFAFGGMNGTAQQSHDFMHFGRTTGGQAITVYGEPIDAGDRSGWEGPSGYGPAQGTDVAYAKAILAQLQAKYNVDSSRVYATGLSNGAGMAVALACQAPDTFAAVAGVATAAYPGVFRGCDNPGQVPTLFLHGTRDHFTWNAESDHPGSGGHALSALQAWGRTGLRNGCDISESNIEKTEKNGFLSMRYRGCTDTEFNLVHDGEHTWFPSSPSASDEVWAFFQKHSR